MTPEPYPLAASTGTSDSLDQGQHLRRRCTEFSIPWLDDAPTAAPEAIELILPETAVRLRIVPLAIRDDALELAMGNPLDIAAADEAAAITGLAVHRIGLDADVFGELMRASYGTTAARMAESLAGDVDESDAIEHNIETIDAEDIHRMAEQPTLINLVNLLLLEAVQSRASDVHIEPFENELRVKYRIDGELQEQTPPPKHLQPALIGRIKIMSSMNIAERFVPQDGHITLRFEGRKVDIRVSTVPTIYGESVAMRILDKSTLPLDLASLGMEEDMRGVMEKMLLKPHGMVLVTGPTGSGKTTTLYAALSKLYDPRKKIITIEEPVEYELEGINQIPVNPKRGLTFSTGLRHILRQDPDVIFVGEIRDSETADIAIRSALTGHLIFSTLHTNDAISSIGRLCDMGVEPYLVSSVLEGVLAQRLGRRVCPECATEFPLSDVQDHRLTPQELEQFQGRVIRGTGCANCNNSGSAGRIGFFELLQIPAVLRHAISEQQSITEMRKCMPSSFRNMRQDGMIKAARGLTTVDEVLRATQDSDDFIDQQEVS